MTTPAGHQLNELGFYALAGHSDSPRDLVDEVRAAERIGLGATFISERFNTKEAATLSGAAGAVSESIGIATAATNHNTRHPIVTATVATTMHRLTGGRFALGLGRGFDAMFRAFGLNPVTSAQLEDVAGLLRRLWRGETVVRHDGPAGSYPYLAQDRDFDENIPLLLVGLGEKTLELAGRCMDAVVLHTFYSEAAVRRALDAVARGAEAAGRDPASVRVWSVLATISDEIPEDLRLKKTIGRLASYLQGYGDLMVRVNDWDPAVLARYRADPLIQGFKGAIDAKATTAELEHIATLIPPEWLATSATGSPRQCAQAVVGQFDQGVSGVILHGATPGELSSVVDVYREIRPKTVRDFPANPGWVA
ncbi:TIGR03857 family LLM class F420-dependent oxidoreductase [Frankia sp. R82]|uniref:TIGR03857 family LLM class F420-dependent oxidoreductase n=1 Tax=Frankia sp. R82 TaxID=2950553 RepID=UPI00204330E3|nr:TIGR03857 family LLM class F420-dependent oxidoreductase [Frankia sp. R82]MCM3884547.1 TIGR03857 family LLM class F420-dependent oxidoreductase [Frankia sp. R82]